MLSSRLAAVSTIQMVTRHQLFMVVAMAMTAIIRVVVAAAAAATAMHHRAVTTNIVSRSTY